MRMLTFARRCAREILRDPLNLAFGLGFPLVLLVLLSALQANIPVPLFEIDTLTPGITVFGLAFMTLFSATLVARDRETALLQRLYTTPLTGLDFILGYLLPLLPIAMGQTAVCYLAAVPLGLDVLARHELWDIIQALKGQVTIILTTHYMEEAQALSDRIGILKDGHLLAVGTAAELMDRAGTGDFETAFVSIVKEGRA